MRLVFILLFTNTILWGESWSMVISKECAPIKADTLQNVYLKKQRFAGICRLVPLNLKAGNPIRDYVMKNVLQISKKSWNYYYNEMHFKGIDPPNIVDSKEAMLKYLSNIKGAIGYIPRRSVNEELYVITEFTP